jgi:hypothetical protein
LTNYQYILAKCFCFVKSRKAILSQRRSSQTDRAESSAPTPVFRAELEICRISVRSAVDRSTNFGVHGYFPLSRATPPQGGRRFACNGPGQRVSGRRYFHRPAHRQALVSRQNSIRHRFAGVKQLGVFVARRRVTYVNQSPGAHLIYAVRRHRISVFVLRDAALQGKWGDAALSPKEPSFNIATWTKGELRYVAISDANKEDVNALATLFKNTSP